MNHEIEELIVESEKIEGYFITKVDEMRFEAALQMLIHRVSRDMKKADAIAEAVKMADELIIHLEKTKK